MAACVYPWFITVWAAFLVVFSGPSEAQQLGPPQSSRGRELCTYQYAIPVGGNCVTDGPAVQQKLVAMQQDIEHAKLQSLSQSNALQDEIRIIENKEARVDNRLTELASEVSSVHQTVMALANSVAQLPTRNGNGNGNGPNNAMLLQLVTATKVELTSAIQKLENDISSLKNQQERSSTLNSAVVTEVQSQLKQNQKNIEMLIQKVSNLQSLATQVQQPATGQSSQPSELMKDMQKDLSDIQSRIAFIEERNKEIHQTVNNHSLAISDAAGQLQFLTNQDRILKTKIDTTYAVVQDNLPNLRSQVQRIAETVSALDQQVKNIGVTSMTATTQHSQQIADLKTEVHLLSTRLSHLTNGATTDSPTPARYNPDNILAPTPRPRSGR